MGTQNFFFVPRLRQDKKHLSIYLYRAQNLPSLLFYSQTLTRLHPNISTHAFSTLSSFPVVALSR